MVVTTGVTADDFASATGIANSMTQQGWRVALLPETSNTTQYRNEEADAIIISPKSRPLSAEQAIIQSLSCACWPK